MATNKDNCYKNAKIYAIRSPNTDEFYIGSTCSPLHKEFYRKKSEYNSWRKGRIGACACRSVMESGEAYIELIEKYPCEDRDEMIRRRGEIQREQGKNLVRWTN